MASKQAVLAAVAAVFGAAGRNYGQVELDLYLVALDDITDDDLADATIATIRGVDFGLRPPSPALLREAVHSSRRRAELESKPEHCEPCDGTGWLEQEDRSMVACPTCARFVTATPLQVRRNLTPVERTSEPVAIGEAAAKLRAARRSPAPTEVSA